MRALRFIFAALCLFCVTFALSASDEPSAARGVYFGGEVHYVSVQKGNPATVALWSSIYPPGDWTYDWGAGPTATVGFDKDTERLDPDKNDHGQGIALMGGVLHHFAVLTDPNKKAYVYLTRCDLTTKKFLEAPRKLIASFYPNGPINGGGVAATVLGDTLYVFTDMNILTSTDGMNYSTHNTWIPPGQVPLDAATFYPPDAPPKMVVAYKNPDRNLGLYALMWDGTLEDPPELVTLDQNGDVRYGALIQGTVKGPHYSAGAKDTPCLQLFVMDEWDYRIRRFEYHVNTDAWTIDPHSYSPGIPMNRFRVFPWYVSNYEPDTAGELREVQRTYLAFTLKECTALACWFHDHQHWGFTSDVLVAQNQDTPPPGGFGWDGVPTATGSGSPEDLETLQKYWTLAGVVLGPPPYGLNDLSEYQIENLSNVHYGVDQSESVSHTQKWENSCMFSSGTSVSGGIGHVAHVSEEIEVGYKHGWEHSHQDSTTSKMEFVQSFGTGDESEGNFGKHGWAVFLQPTLVTQMYDVYAYDYNSDTDSGSYLGQGLYTISTGRIGVTAYQFRLASPGGPEDEVPGLLEGLKAYPESTDLEGWRNQDWEPVDAPWTVIAGCGLAPTVKQGTESECNFTQTTKTLDSKGQTSDVEVKSTTEIGIGLKIAGFHETLKAGYDSHYSNETETETEVSRNISYKYHLPTMSDECTEPDCVKSLEVQPYLLQATDYSAPWIPSGYNHQLPWCMTWRVTRYETVGCGTVGESPPPDGASGTVTGSGGPGESFPESTGTGMDEYWVHGGRMAWLGEDGSVDPIPITAAQFNPCLGAFVTVNGRLFTTVPFRGKWRRKGEVWTYKTKKSEKGERILLKLDFGRGTWDFRVRNTDLSNHIQAGDPNVRVELAVNDQYRFFRDIRHRVRADWTLQLPAVLPEGLEILEASGHHDTWFHEGHFSLRGDLPENLESFGDFSILVNGHRHDFRLLSIEGFQEMLETGGELIHEQGNVRLNIDFGEGTWAAHFSDSDFHEHMAPRRGGIRLEAKVGGATWYSKEHPVHSFTINLF